MTLSDETRWEGVHVCFLPGACCDIRNPRIWSQWRDVWVQVKSIRVLPEIILIVKPRREIVISLASGKRIQPGTHLVVALAVRWNT